jgi:hypothetical protein
MFDEPTPDLFRKLVTKAAHQRPPGESKEKNTLKAFVKMKQVARRQAIQKARRFKWEPKVGDLILLKRQAVSDESAGQISKFMMPYIGPLKVTRLIPPSTYEISEVDGRLKGVCHKSALKPYVATML